MINIRDIADELRSALDETNSVREEAIKLSRETIRLSANSIRASHRGDYDDACELKEKARTKVLETKELLKNNGEVYYTGYVQDAQKEYTESELTYAIIRELPFPKRCELGVEAPAYLNGIAEAIGETRRHTLDLVRAGDMERAQRALNIMDEVFYVLITFDYPDAVTCGIRRQTDMVRGVLEKTRGEITILFQQQKLEKTLHEAVNKLYNE